MEIRELSELIYLMLYRVYQRYQVSFTACVSSRDSCAKTGCSVKENTNRQLGNPILLFEFSIGYLTKGHGNFVANKIIVRTKALPERENSTLYVADDFA